MSIKLSPYLALNGNAREAMEFYKSVFGGELTVNTMGEYPNAPAGKEDKLMHAQLVSDAITIMASDGMGDDALKAGEMIRLSLTGDDEARLTDIFNALAEGGEVTMPLSKQMWGDVFGILTDKYGFQWMVNINQS